MTQSQQTRSPGSYLPPFGFSDKPLKLDLSVVRPKGQRLTFATPPPIGQFLEDIQSINRLLMPKPRVPVTVIDILDGKVKQVHFAKTAYERIIALMNKKRKIIRGKVSKSTKRKWRIRAMRKAEEAKWR